MADSLHDKRSFYNTIADSFDEIMNQYDVGRRLDVVFAEMLGGLNLGDLNLLDAGCGTGRFSERACSRGARVVSLDIGPSLLARVRHRCPARVVCGDATRLALPTDYFDLVISSECIEHTPSPQAAVREFVRVCKPGGRIVITCPNKLWHWSCVVANALGIRPYEGLENWPGWWQLRGWIKGTGARITRARGIHLLPFNIKALQPLLRKLDALGRGPLGPLHINQAIMAVKPAE